MQLSFLSRKVVSFFDWSDQAARDPQSGVIVGVFNFKDWGHLLHLPVARQNLIAALL
jgi:hypothetical protein